MFFFSCVQSATIRVADGAPALPGVTVKWPDVLLSFSICLMMLCLVPIVFYFDRKYYLFIEDYDLFEDS